MQGNDVHVTFRENEAIRLLVLREVQGKQATALVEDERVGGVEVFRLAVSENAAAERDYVSAQVDDRKHHAVEEAVHRAAVSSPEGDVGADGLLLREALIPEMVDEREPARRRKAEAEMADGLQRQRAAAQILHALPPHVGVENGVVIAGGLPVELEHPPALRGHAVVGAAFGHLESRPVRQEAHRLKIIELLNLSDKRDNVPSHMAAEAVEGAVVGIDVKRRRLFSVERTQPHKVSP